MKKAAIIVLNFNGEKDTIACLESLRSIDSSGLMVSIIVVDNGSKEEGFAYLKTESKEIEFKNIAFSIIDTGINKGFAGGMNVGIKSALENDSDYIVLLNNDTIVDKNFLKELVKTAESNPKIGLVSPKIYFVKGFEFHKGRYKKEEMGKVFWYAGGIMDWANILGHHRGVDEVDSGQYEKEEETDFATGCCLLIKKEVVEKVGLLDESLFLYYEEGDFNQRVKKTGYRIYYSPKAIVWHKNARSAGGSGSHLQDYFITRNRLIFGMRYASLRAKLALLKESLHLLKNGREWQKKGVKDFYLRKLGKGSYPL